MDITQTTIIYILISNQPLMRQKYHRLVTLNKIYMIIGLNKAKSEKGGERRKLKVITENLQFNRKVTRFK